MSMGVEDNLSEREQAALTIIQERNGIHQSELWKELDISSRSATRVVRSLQDMDLIEREETTYRGRKTYYLSPVIQPEDLDFSLLMAGDKMFPGVDSDQPIDPVEDTEFEEWIIELTQHDR